MSRPPILFVGALHTEIGQTTMTVSLVKQARSLGGHPVGICLIDVGCPYNEHSDLYSPTGDKLREARELPVPPLVVAPYRFPVKNLGPKEAAEKAGLSLSLKNLEDAVHTATEFGDLVIVELPGTITQTIVKDATGLDLASKFDAPVLLLSDSSDESRQQIKDTLPADKNPNLKVVYTNIKGTNNTSYPEDEFPIVPNFEQNAEEETLNFIRNHSLLQKMFQTDHAKAP